VLEITNNRMVKKCSLIVSLIILLTGFNHIAAVADEWQDRANQVRSKDVPLNFYGKVIDQELKPVIDVAVTVQIAYFDPTVPYSFTGVKSVVVHTDTAGLFSIEDQVGSAFSVSKISKEGYEYLYRELAFERIKADKHKPVIFNVRKKEKSEFIIPGEFHFAFDSRNTAIEVDLIKRQFAKPGILGTRDWAKDEQADIKIRTTLDSNSHYVVTFSTPDKGDGIIVSDQLLYVAPPDGYAPSQTLILPMPGDLQKTLYLKGRQGRSYSRLNVRTRATAEKLNVSIDSWTNPNGSRNVDYDGKTYSQEIVRQSKEKKARSIEREKQKKLEPLTCCIYSFARADYGLLNCGLPVNNACSKGTGHPWACEKLDWCKE